MTGLEREALRARIDAVKRERLTAAAARQAAYLRSDPAYERELARQRAKRRRARAAGSVG